MKRFLTANDIEIAYQAIRQQTSYSPEIAMILGSGLGPFAESIEEDISIKTKFIPGWPESTVEGHEGRLVFGHMEKLPVLVMQGRVHYYEGHSMAEIGLPVRVMQRMGINTLIVTNASGALNPDFEHPELMLIVDHINLLGITGQNPLRGPNLDSYGPRFPDMSQVYDQDLINLARKVSRNENIRLYEGVYICLAGPMFETPADLRFLRQIGVDAVGMSTVPEVIVARHGGMKVLGISSMTNKAYVDGKTETTYDEVIEGGKIIIPKLVKLIRGILRGISQT